MRALLHVVLALFARTARSQRCSFVTALLSEDFVGCSEAWVRSIRAQTTHEVHVLALPEISAEARSRLLEAGADQVVAIEEVQNPNKVVQYQAFAKNYAITRVWQLSSLTGISYDKAVYMDSDMVVTQNCDDLCDAPELSAARDLGARPTDEASGHIRDFNAGLMVLRPSEATFARLLELAPTVGSASGGVQPLLRVAFPNFHLLDHLQDNVNARVYDLSRGSWNLSKIRSIHFTGPLKPCFTREEDFAEEELDQPMRVWHRLQRGLSSQEAVSQASAQKENGLRVLSAKEAWRKWLPVDQDSVLTRLFGFGESELQFVAAHHVCKHGSNTLAKLAEQVFVVGYRQLLSCLGPGPCQAIAEVRDWISRSVDLMQRTLRLYVQRASADAQVDAFGLGSAVEALEAAAEEAKTRAEATLRLTVREERVAGSRCVFDIVMALAKELQNVEETCRWRLSHILLALLWWQLRQLREETGEALLAPESFDLRLPTLQFEPSCCQRGRALAEVFKKKASEGVLVVPDGQLDPDLEAQISLEAPHIRLFLPELGIESLPEVPDNIVVLLGCAPGASLEPEEDLQQLRSRIQAFESFRVTFAGCGFVAGRPGLVEAVSQRCIQAGATLHLGVDAIWWIEDPP